MTVARQVIAKRTYLITRRCRRRKFSLRPDPAVENIYLYCLGEAVQRYRLTLHAYLAMGNHHHIQVRDNEGNFPEFLAQMHKNIAKAMNALRGERENFWATEQPNAVYLVEAGDRFDKLVYLLANPVNADLVDRASDWPGATSLGLCLSGRSITVKRPPQFFRSAGNMPAEVTLRIERPDGFEMLTEAEWNAKLMEAVRDAEERARKKRREEGKTILGRKAVLRTSVKDRPKKPEPRRTIRPRIGCLNIERRIHELTTLKDFCKERKVALRRHLAPERDVLFPHGTYRVEGYFIAAPPPTAMLQLSA